MNEFLKPLDWTGSSKKDLRTMPAEVQREFGYALYLTQASRKHEKAKALKGFGSAGVLEVVTSDKAAPSGLSIPSESPVAYTSCIAFRRSLCRVSPHRSRIWASFGSG